MSENLKVVISGGGTGGHIFPAISIANAIKARFPNASILFVGALGRMEMERVPQAGYEIKGLPIKGFDRKNLFKNINVLRLLFKSLILANNIIREFKPMVAVGVGGYASAPVLYQSARKGIPCLIQEQNSYAGVANRILSKRVDRICVAYDGMKRFFPEEKIIKTGNPIRQSLLDTTLSREEALKSFSLKQDVKTILIVGGSLGARTLNISMLENLDKIRESKIQFIWQTGKYYYDDIIKSLKTQEEIPNLKVMDFISEMNLAYKASDLIISRAGASSISEFSLIGKPVILVPSPNVAEDHQTKNAMALVNQGAAILIKDSEAPSSLVETAIKTVSDDKALELLSYNIKSMALPDSADMIAQEVIRLAFEKK